MNALPALQHRKEAFEARDAFVKALLGLLRHFDRFDRLVSLRHPASEAATPNPDETLDAPLAVVLGAIALRTQIGALLRSIPADEIREPSNVAARTAKLRELLR